MINLLIVDDEMLIRAKLKKYIKELGFEIKNIYEAGNGAIALDIIKQTQIDIAIVDIQMPKMTGIEFIKNLREKNYKTKIIFLTGFEKFEYAKEAITYKASAYLLKPVKKNELYSVIKNLLLENMSVDIVEEEVEKTTSDNLLINNVLEYLNEHYTSSELTLNIIAENFYINSSYLSSTFKKEINKSITEYILEKRITLAKTLLQDKDIKIADIPDKIGYKDYYYFSKTFKKHVGISPLKYKQLNNN